MRMSVLIRCAFVVVHQCGAGVKSFGGGGGSDILCVLLAVSCTVRVMYLYDCEKWIKRNKINRLTCHSRLSLEGSSYSQIGRSYIQAIVQPHMYVYMY